MNRTAINCALYLDQLAVALTIWAYSAGVLFLAGKVLGLPPERLSVLCFLSLILPFVVAFACYYPHRFSRAYLLAWLDLHNQAGGRLLSSDSLRAEEMAALRVMPSVSVWPLVRKLLLPLAFFAGAWLVPAPTPQEEATAGKGVQSRVRALERKAAEFAEKELLPKPVEQQLAEQLKRVEQAAQTSPEAAAESLSVLEQKLEKSVLMRLSAGLQSEEKTQSAAKSLEGKGGMDASAAEVGQMLAALENQMAAEGGALPSEIQKAMQELMQKMGAGSLPEMKGMSSSALANMKPEDLKKLLEALKKQNAKNCAACKEMSSMMTGKDAAEALKKMMAGTPSLSKQGLGLSEMGMGEGEGEDGPGSGGVSRGRGDARLTFGQEADREGTKFEAKVLPSSGVVLPGVTLSQEREQPGVQEPPEEFRGIVRTGAQVRGSVNAGESGTVLSPARSQAAQQYFEQLSKPANK